MFFKILVYLVSVILTVNCQYNDTGIFNVACNIPIRGNQVSPQPLYIRPGTSQFFLPANRFGDIQMTAGQPMELWCSEGWDGPISGAPNLITATCVSGLTLRYNNANFHFMDFRCRDWPQWTKRRVDSPRCFNNARFVDVGFWVGTRWFQVYRSCHDEVLETNWYSFYQFTPAADGAQLGVERTESWQQRDFFPGKVVTNLYNVANQRRTIGTILNCDPCANVFVEPPGSDIFLARGHMAAMTDFIYAAVQFATFTFINSAPQWQSFNARNWVDVEISSRRLASERNLNLDVYTGTFGNGQLWNNAQSRFNIFLDHVNRQIPMPMLFYKIIVNNADQSGVVLIGKNVPSIFYLQVIQIPTVSM